MHKEDDSYDCDEGARPSSLRSVHKLATPDPLYDQQLLRDVAIINERVRRELGPPRWSNPTPTKQSASSANAQTLRENDPMKLQDLAAVAALSVSTTSAWASTDPQRPSEVSVPANVASFIGEDKALLAYKAVHDGSGGKNLALVLRYPKEPDPGLEKTADDRIPYSCELIMLREEEGGLRVTGRSQDAVDCTFNEINRRAAYMELSDQLELSPTTVTFMNDNIRGGSYSYAFGFSEGVWHLSGATSFYKSGYDEMDGVQMTKEEASYPKDFGLIPMDKFDSNDIIGALANNRSLVR